MLVSRSAVTVKDIVTDRFRDALVIQRREYIKKIDETISELEHRRENLLLESKDKDAAQTDPYHIKSQIRTQIEHRKRALAILAEAEALNIGDECFRTKIIGIADIQVGDNLDEKLAPSEIILKDGVVIEIRSINDRK